MGRDIKQEVTDRIIAALEKGVVPWQRPWHVSGDGMPRNGNSGRHYSGINVALLWMTAQERGYRSNEWFTYQGARKAGGHVLKGEHGTLVTFWKQITIREVDEDTGEEKDKRIPLLRHFTLFNREQIEGLPEVQVEERDPVEVDAAANEYVARTGASITYGSNQACYDRRADSITVPGPDQYDDPAAFHSTVFHELTHWTGAPDRLNRAKGAAFGDNVYAAEELVAEMGAAFLCGQFGLQGRTQHPEYIGHWITVLKADKGAVIRAASGARQAVEYLDGLQEEEQEEAAGTDLAA